MNIREDTIQYFAQKADDVIQYYQNRKVSCETLFSLLHNQPFALLNGTVFFTADGEEFGLSHFLGKSDIPGYDIEFVNNALNLNRSSNVAIALAVGDDIICYNKRTHKVYLWMVETFNGKKKLIANSLDEFIKNIK